MDESSLEQESVQPKNVNLPIDSSTFTLDCEDRTWIGPGDYLQVEFSKEEKPSPTLTIQDSQNPKKLLAFTTTDTIPFELTYLSDFTEHFTFSVEREINDCDTYEWQVEIVRDRFPDLVKGKDHQYQSQVNFFFNLLSPKSTAGGMQPGPQRGSGGGFEPA